MMLRSRLPPTSFNWAITARCCRYFSKKKKAGKKEDLKRNDRIKSYMHHYLGPQNLPKDKFMLKELKNNGGWMTGDCFCTFPKIKALRNVTPDELAEALDGSKVVESSIRNGKISFRPFMMSASGSESIEDYVGIVKNAEKKNRTMPNFVHGCQVRNPSTIANIESAMKIILEEAGKCHSNFCYYPIGFDVEYATVDKGGERLPALLSICARTGENDRVWLIWLDKLENRGFNFKSLPPSLHQVLADPRILKVGNGVWGDGKSLSSVWADHGAGSDVAINGVLELRHVAKEKISTEMDPRTQLSLQVLCANFLNRKMVKSKTTKEKSKRSHWRAAAMTTQMKNYAADDAAVALQLYYKFIENKAMEDIEDTVSQNVLSFSVSSSGQVFTSVGAGDLKKVVMSG